MLLFQKKYFKVCVSSIIILSLFLQFFPAQSKASLIDDVLAWFADKIKLPNELKLTNDGNIEIGNWGTLIRCIWKNDAGQCANPFSYITLGENQIPLIDDDGKLIIPRPKIPKICELAVPLPPEDELLTQKEKLALAKSCSDYRKIQRVAANLVYFSKKIFNNTDPLSECFFVKNCKTYCTFHLGGITYTIGWLDIAAFFLPAGWLNTVRKILNIIKKINEIRTVFKALKTAIKDVVVFVNSIFSQTAYLITFLTSVSNIIQTLIGDNFLKVIERFAGNLFKYMQAKSEAFNINNELRNRSISLANQIKSVEEIQFLYQEDSSEKETLQNIFYNYAPLFINPEQMTKQVFASYKPIKEITYRGEEEGKYPFDLSCASTITGCHLANFDIHIYEHKDYGGNEYSVISDIPNLKDIYIYPVSTWNDMVSSIKINGDGKGSGITLFEHKNYEGRSITFFSDVSNLHGIKDNGWDWNDKVSSIKIGHNLPDVCSVDSCSEGECAVRCSSGLAGLFYFFFPSYPEEFGCHTIDFDIPLPSSIEEEASITVCCSADCDFSCIKPILVNNNDWFGSRLIDASDYITVSSYFNSLWSNIYTLNNMGYPAPVFEVALLLHAASSDINKILQYKPNLLLKVSNLPVNAEEETQYWSTSSDSYAISSLSLDHAWRQAASTCSYDSDLYYFDWDQKIKIIEQTDLTLVAEIIDEGVIENLQKPLMNYQIKKLTDELETVSYLFEEGITFFEHKDYGGASTTIVFDTPNLKDIGWNDKVSSIKPSDYTAHVYVHANYTGDELFVDSDIPNLNLIGWNDMISSVKTDTEINNLKTNLEELKTGFSALNESWHQIQEQEEGNIPVPSIYIEKMIEVKNNSINISENTLPDCWNAYQQIIDLNIDDDALSIFLNNVAQLLTEIENAVGVYEYENPECPGQDFLSELRCFEQDKTTLEEMLILAQAIEKLEIIPSKTTEIQDSIGELEPTLDIPSMKLDVDIGSFDDLLSLDFSNIDASLTYDGETIDSPLDFMENLFNSPLFYLAKVFNHIDYLLLNPGGLNEQSINRLYLDARNLLLENASTSDLIQDVWTDTEESFDKLSDSMDSLDLAVFGNAELRQGCQALGQIFEKTPAKIEQLCASNQGIPLPYNNVLELPDWFFETCFIRDALISVLEANDPSFTLADFCGQEDPGQWLEENFLQNIHGEEFYCYANPAGSSDPEASCLVCCRNATPNGEIEIIDISPSIVGSTFADGLGNVVFDVKNLSFGMYVFRDKESGDAFSEGIVPSSNQCCSGEFGLTQEQIDYICSERDFICSDDCNGWEGLQALQRECNYYDILQHALQNNCDDFENQEDENFCDDLRGYIDYLINYCPSWEDVIPDLTDEANSAQLDKARKVCSIQLSDIKTPLGEVMKVFSILLGIKSGSRFWNGIETSKENMLKAIGSVQKFISLVKELPAMFNQKPPETFESGGFKIDYIQCETHPAFGVNNQTGPQGGPVCPKIDYLFSIIESNFAVMRDRLNNMRLLGKEAKWWGFGLKDDRATIRVSIVETYFDYPDGPYMDKYEPLWDKAKTIKRKAQNLWALATALNFANSKCTCGQSFCKLPLCISGIPLTLDPLISPYCWLTWILRHPLLSLAKELADELGIPIEEPEPEGEEEEEEEECEEQYCIDYDCWDVFQPEWGYGGEVLHWSATITIGFDGDYKYCVDATPSGPSPCTPDIPYTNPFTIEGNERSGPETAFVVIKNIDTGELIELNIQLSAGCY